MECSLNKAKLRMMKKRDAERFTWNRVREVLFEPANKSSERREDLTSEAKAFRGHSDKLMLGGSAWHVGEGEFSRQLLTGREIVWNPEKQGQ